MVQAYDNKFAYQNLTILLTETGSVKRKEREREKEMEMEGERDRDRYSNSY